VVSFGGRPLLNGFDSIDPAAMHARVGTPLFALNRVVRRHYRAWSRRMSTSTMFSPPRFFIRCSRNVRRRSAVSIAS
jgi:hypothetical protein